MEREKPLHGKYPLRTYNAGVDRATTHQWLISSSLKGETEGFILSTQDQSKSIPAYQSRILKNGADPNRRPCTETHTHTERERERERERGNSRFYSISMSYNTYYLQRLDRVASFIHWILCKTFNLPHTEKWYEHTPQPVTEIIEAIILWDFTINTDRKIGAN